jgi:hypothetical protein
MAIFKDGFSTANVINAQLERGIRPNETCSWG